MPPPIARYADDVPGHPGERYQTAKGLMTDLRKLNLDMASGSAISAVAAFGAEQPKGIASWMKQWRFWNKDNT